MAYQNFVTATIAAGSSLSSIINTNSMAVESITTGSNVSGSTLTFLGSVDGINFYPVMNNSGVEYSALSGSAANASPRFIYLDDGSMDSLKSFKVRIGTSASSINQVTDPAIITIGLVDHK